MNIEELDLLTEIIKEKILEIEKSKTETKVKDSNNAYNVLKFEKPNLLEGLLKKIKGFKKENIKFTGFYFIGLTESKSIKYCYEGFASDLLPLLHFGQKLMLENEIEQLEFHEPNDED